MTFDEKKLEQLSRNMRALTLRLEFRLEHRWLNKPSLIWADNPRLEQELRDVRATLGEVLGEDPRSATELAKTLEWMRQTVHRAHHGANSLDDCTLNTCDAALKALGRR